MGDLEPSTPSNLEFFEFLAKDLSFSVFQRSGSTLVSFKGTIEFVLVPEGTGEGPEDGVLFEGVAPMSYEDWQELVAGCAMISVESRHEPAGDLSRHYRARENDAPAPRLPPLTRAPSLDEESAAVREEMVSERGRYLWAGPSRERAAVGRFTLHLRRIACRGSDSGMSARAVFSDKMRQYQRQALHAAGLRQRRTVAAAVASA